jgi:hypothetical protein
MDDPKKIIIKGIGLILLSLAILAIVLTLNFWPKTAVTPEPVVSGTGDGIIEGKPDVPGDCASMGNSVERQTCYDRRHLSEILYTTKNIKDCLMFDDLAFRNDCLFRMARTRTDARYCAKLAGKDERLRCVQDIAINSNDPALCDNGEGNTYATQECADRVKATNIGKNGETSLPVDYCAKIKTLEYGKLCVLYASRNGVRLAGSTGERDFKESFDAHIIYRSAKTEADCETIEFEGGRLACAAMIKDGNFDYDKDGVADYNELWFGIDPSKKDTDGDGLADYDEMANGCNPSAADTDRDGLSDNEEVSVYRSACSDSDSDGDGINDGNAVKSGNDPVASDQDRDGLAGELEKKIGTDASNSDSDGDGVNDGDEWNIGFNPLKKGQMLFDTDNDGLNDIDEIFYGSNRLKADSDGDGKDDLYEIERLSNPIGQGDLDFDMDGLSDIQEAERGTNPAEADSDGDGMPDLNEVMGGTDPLAK